MNFIKYEPTYCYSSSKVNLNEDGIDRYQKNIKELNDLIKKQDLNINEVKTVN